MAKPDSSGGRGEGRRKKRAIMSSLERREVRGLLSVPQQGVLSHDRLVEDGPA